MLAPLAALLLLVPLGAALGGCATRDPGPVTFSVEPGRYADAIEAAQRVLDDRGYAIERIDARNGVVTAGPKQTTGILTPFDSDQSSARDEWQDFANVQRRTVRVVLEAGAAPDSGTDPEPGISTPAAPAAAPPSVADSAGPWTGRVEVVIERRHRPNRRIEPESIRRSTRFRDPALEARGMQPAYYVAVRRDPDLAGRLARAIEDRLAGD